MGASLMIRTLAHLFYKVMVLYCQLKKLVRGKLWTIRSIINLSSGMCGKNSKGDVYRVAFYANGLTFLLALCLRLLLKTVIVSTSRHTQNHRDKLEFGVSAIREIYMRSLKSLERYTGISVTPRKYVAKLLCKISNAQSGITINHLCLQKNILRGF